MIEHSLPISGSSDALPPVYTCRAVVTPPSGDQYHYSAFAGNLPEVTGGGPTERECLLDLVTQFKRTLQTYRESNTPIPWTDPPIAPEEGQQQRWIPVHL